MFDRTYSETKICPVTRVVEKSISPDKVADLYSEVKKEVEARILETVHVENNLFKAKYISLKNYQTGDKEILWKIMLGGKELTGKVPFAKDMISTNERDAFFTNKIIESQFSEIMKAINS